MNRDLLAILALSLSTLALPACDKGDLALRTVYADADGDGFGGTAVDIPADAPTPDGYTDSAGDCDDTNPNIHPDAAEVCGGLDDDCDELIDEEDDSFTEEVPTWYADSDGDGFGDPSSSTEACLAPTGAVSNDDDCDDTRAWVSPSALEACDGLDTDCDGVQGAEEQDEDEDGYLVCGPALGDVALGGDDCDDQNPDVYPGAPELPDGAVNDCEGALSDSRADLGQLSGQHAVEDVADLVFIGSANSGYAGWSFVEVDNAGAPTLAITELGGNGGEGIVRFAPIPANGQGQVLLQSAPYIDETYDSGSVATQFGNGLAVGDLLGGDGVPDLVIAAPYAGVVCVVAGPFGDLGVHSTVNELTAADGVLCIEGQNAMGLDDVTVLRFNEDEYDDLVIGGYGGRALVFLGSEQGLDAESTAVPDFKFSTHLGQRNLVFSTARHRAGQTDELVLSFPYRDVEDRVDAGMIHGVSWEDIDETINCSVDSDGAQVCVLEEGSSWTLYGVYEEQKIGRGLFAGDHDNDGTDELALNSSDSTSPYGAPYEEVLVFDGQTLNAGGGASLWTSSASLRVASPTLDSGFGTNFAFGGDYDGDGRADLAIGAQYYSSHQGAVYVYFADTLDQPWLITTPDLELFGSEGSRLGRRVRAADLDGDGCDDLLMGAHRADVSSADQSRGKVYGLLSTCI